MRMRFTPLAAAAALFALALIALACAIGTSACADRPGRATSDAGLSRAEAARRAQALEALGARMFVDPSLSPMLLMTDAGRAEAQLSEREREILQLLAKGYHTEEVARAIGLEGRS